MVQLNAKLALAAPAAALALLATAAPVTGEEASVKAHDTAAHDDVRLPFGDRQVDAMMVEAFRERYSLSMDTARFQLGLQQLMDVVPYAMLDPYVVEVYSVPGADFIIRYLTTSEVGPSGEVLGRLKALELDGFVKWQTVSASAQELRDAQIVAVQKARSAGEQVAASIDPVTSQVVVETVEPTSHSVQESVEAAVASVAPTTGVAWRTVDAMPVPAVGGSRALGSNECTGGFVVTKISSGNRGLSTAAHCGNSATYDGKPLNFKAEKYSGSQDVQWMDNDSISWEPRLLAGGEWRWITGRTAYSNVRVNDWVCKRGATTNTTCGQVTDRDFCPSYVVSCNATFVVVSGSEPVDWAEGGDSGGPVYEDSSAVGLVSGYWSGSDPRGLFMPQEFMAALDLRVTIQ